MWTCERPVGAASSPHSQTARTPEVSDTVSGLRIESSLITARVGGRQVTLSAQPIPPGVWAAIAAQVTPDRQSLELAQLLEHTWEEPLVPEELVRIGADEDVAAVAGAVAAEIERDPSALLRFRGYAARRQGRRSLAGRRVAVAAAACPAAARTRYRNGSARAGSRPPTANSSRCSFVLTVLSVTKYSPPVRRLALPRCCSTRSTSRGSARAGTGMFVGATEDNVRSLSPLIAKSKMDMAALAGLDTVRMSVLWQPGEQRIGGDDEIVLRNASAAAQLDGVRLVVSIYPRDWRSAPLTRGRAASSRRTRRRSRRSSPRSATSSSATSRTSTSSGCRSSGWAAPISRRAPTSCCSRARTTRSSSSPTT